MSIAVFKRLPDVQEKYAGGVVKSTLYKWIRNQQFPEPVKVGRVSMWRVSELEAWAENPEAWQPEEGA